MSFSEFTKAITKFGIGGVITTLAVYIPYIRWEWFTLHVLGPEGYRLLQSFLLIIGFSMMLSIFAYLVRKGETT